MDFEATAACLYMCLCTSPPCLWLLGRILKLSMTLSLWTVTIRDGTGAKLFCV